MVRSKAYLQSHCQLKISSTLSITITFLFFFCSQRPQLLDVKFALPVTRVLHRVSTKFDVPTAFQFRANQMHTTD